MTAFRKNTMMQFIAVVCLVFCLVRTTHAKAGLCEVETGHSSIIMDIEESRGSYVGQSTIPAEIPIEGDPFSEIILDLVFPKGNPLFILNGKKLQLLEPLDRDAENLSHIVFQLTCLVKATKKKRTIPVIVRVSDVNDNAPEFLNTPYETTVSELTPIGTTIFQNIKANDIDSGVNSLAEYFIVEGDGKNIGIDSGIGNNRVNTADGFGYFSINLPHQGQVTVNRSLDYEKTQRYLVTIVASDRARNSSERLSSTTTLTVNIKDDDDQDPSFIYKGCMLHDGACINPEYFSSVMSGILAGTLNIQPEKIQAIDMDTINSPIRYSILRGAPSSYNEYFEINPSTGAVRQTKAVDTGVAKKFDLIIKAEEMSEAKRFTTAKLMIVVKPVDANPPVIHASSTEGHVNENEPIGTKVLDKNGEPIHLSVTDEDLGPNDLKPMYSFELTTNYFQIDRNGILVVNEENLDRDPPSPGIYRFQVVARELNGQAASSPLSLEVALDDVNDNAPILVPLPHVNVPAGEGRRHVVKVEATDNDFGENAKLTYGIYHVSNNGASKFKIDPKTGDIETVGKLETGEQYSITVQAKDIGGLSSQGIVEVNVSPGPNTRAPIFKQNVYEVQVSEGASLNSSVITLTAVDPENDPIIYSIISGNDLRQFGIGSNNGIISIIRKLDREDLTRYQLMVKAEDPGKLSTTATVNIKVTDINDKNPEFVESEMPYIFKIKEGLANATVGRVRAIDLDEGINALVSYSLPQDVPFVINNHTGEITTKVALDYETKKDYSFVVTAKDGASEPRIGTASVTVQVLDVPDEVPTFQKSTDRISVPENVPDFLVTKVTANDPDTMKEITYIIKQGNTDMFSIDRKTGVVKTLRGLDYERENMYVLVIGTEENNSNDDGSTIKVYVDVEDRNDLPPTFTSVPRPITLDDEVSIGTIVTTMIATDSDGTAPNNKVRYQLVGRGMASKYFQIDSDTGVLRIRDDLRKELSSEYQVDIRAYDLGEPQLSSVSTLSIYVRHVATVPPEIGLSFADTSYTEEVLENATANTLLKTIVIINHRAHSENIPLKCEISKGNDQKLFYAIMTDDRNCAIYLKSPSLDYENRTEYLLEVHLDSLQGLVNPDKSYASLKLHVKDVNDNTPTFIYPDQSEIKLARKKYYAIVSKDMDLDSNIIQVQARDSDSGNFGKILFKESKWSDLDEEFFNLDSKSGIIRNSKTFETVPEEKLPFVLNVLARDNPDSRSDYKSSIAPVIVNLLTKDNELILVFKDARPESIRLQAKNITRVLEEKSNLIVGIEKFTPRQYITENETLEMDPTGTDVWFYAIDPNSGKILNRNSTRVQRSITDPGPQSNITFVMSGAVRATAAAIRAPLPPPTPPRARLSPAAPDAFPYALIIIACIIFVLGLAGIIYICVSWNRYRNYKSRIQRHYTNAPSRYDPVISGPAPSIDTPSLKEYETQVLNMAVPLDDCDSCNDLQLDFSANNHTFSLDNVSYITKDNGQQSPTSSEAATTARASSVASPTDYMHSNIHTLNRNNVASIYRNNNHHLSTLPRNDHHHHHNQNNSFLDTFGRNNNRNQQQNNTFNRNKNNLNLLTKTLGKEKNENKNNNTLKRNPEAAIMAYDEIPGHNTIFQRSSDEEGMASPSNDNVTFGKRDYSQMGFSYLNDRSPVETTTEL